MRKDLSLSRWGVSTYQLGGVRISIRGYPFTGVLIDIVNIYFIITSYAKKA
jgi:hypothetical protein